MKKLSYVSIFLVLTLHAILGDEEEMEQDEEVDQEPSHLPPAMIAMVVLVALLIIASNTLLCGLLVNDTDMWARGSTAKHLYICSTLIYFSGNKQTNVLDGVF